MHIANKSAVLSLPNLQRFRCCTKCLLALITCSQPARPCQPQAIQPQSKVSWALLSALPLLRGAVQLRALL